MRKFSYISILMMVFMVVASQTGWADEATLDTGDNAWILTSSALVLLMIPGRKWGSLSNRPVGPTFRVPMTSAPTY